MKKISILALLSLLSSVVLSKEIPTAPVKNYVRGDVPIVPQRPDLDPSSKVMFRPSHGAEDLNNGAISVLKDSSNGSKSVDNKNINHIKK
jgi:hypothetical protein